MTVGAPALSLDAAAQAMRAGRLTEAHALLSEVVRRQPGLADGWRLLGLTLKRLGDAAKAEEAFRAAIAIDKRRPAFHADLGALLAETGRAREAERSLRAALALDRRFVPAVLALAELFCAMGRPAEALQLTTPLAAAQGAEEAVLAAHAEALKALGRHQERLSIYQRAAAAYPHSAVAEHNLASALGDLDRHDEAEAAVHRAFQKGLDAPETWLLLGRALQGQDRFEPAQEAFRQAIRRRPAYAMAHAELAQLIWMQSEDGVAAGAALDAAIDAYPVEPSLRMAKSKLLDYAGDAEGAYAVLEAAAARADAPAEIHTAAARAALKLDPGRALAHAEAAVAVARGGPQTDAAELALCEALLACGRPEAAARTAEGLHTRRPLDQHVLAYQATAWRLLGDPRHLALYDYQTLVRPWTIDTPPGWPSLAAYLADLKTSLLALHGLRTHPIGQSLRSGTQTNRNLRTVEDPVIRAFFQAIDGPIRRHIAAIGKGRDPLRSRSLGGYAVADAWSVRLRPGQGRHVDHVHQKGWISSACYIDLPPAVEAGGQEGWIKFGEPGTPTAPHLGPEHAVKPEPGMLVLFPSYMWHGTIPFGGDQPRLTAALDILPAR